jgi:carboxylesterase type B
MEDYWYSFAKTGDPNGEGRPGWTAFDKGFLQMHLTADGCAMEDFDRDGSLSEREKAFTD